MGFADVPIEELDKQAAAAAAEANGVNNTEVATDSAEKTAEQSEIETQPAEEAPEKEEPKATPEPAKKEAKDWRDRYYSTVTKKDEAIATLKKELEALKSAYDPEQVALIEKIASAKVAEKEVEMESQREVRSFFRDYPDFAAHKEWILEVKEAFPNMSVEKAAKFYMAENHPELLQKKPSKSMSGSLPSSVKKANSLDVMSDKELREMALKEMSKL